MSQKNDNGQLDLFSVAKVSQPSASPVISTAATQHEFPNADLLCVDAVTELLTKQGWVTLDEMTYDHAVANWESSGRIVFTQPRFILQRERQPNEPMVCLQTLRRSIRVVGTRPLLFRPSRFGYFQSRSALDVINCVGEIPICGYAEPEQHPLPVIEPLSEKQMLLKVRSNSYHLRQAGMEPMQAKEEALRRIQDRYNQCYKTASELTLDECRLIGFWLGDGTWTKDGRASMTQALVYPRIIAWVDEVLSQCNYHFSRHVNSDYKNPHVLWCFSRGTGFGPQKRDGLFPIMPYLDKQGSELWKNFTREQFQAFLEGLWYADGDHGKAETVPDTKRISNTNKKMLDLIQQIAICRSLSSTVSESPRTHRKPNHNILYTLKVSRFQTHALTKHRFQLDSNPYQPEKVWTVINETGHVITRRNNRVAIL